MINLKLVDESSFQTVLDLKISEADERARFVCLLYTSRCV